MIALAKFLSLKIVALLIAAIYYYPDVYSDQSKNEKEWIVYTLAYMIIIWVFFNILESV